MKRLVCGPIAGVLLVSTAFAEPAGSVSATGRLIAAADEILLGSAATGVVAALHVSDGERVHAGQLLVSLDCKPIEADVKVREQEAAVADAILRRVKDGYRVEEIAIAAAAVKAAEAVAENAATARQRAVALKVDNTATQARIDAAERDALTSVAGLEEARQRLSMLRTGSRPEDIEAATASRDVAQAVVVQTRARLDQCSIRSPSDGIVLSINVTAGRFVSDVNQGALLRLVDDSKRRVRVEVDETELAKVCVGQEAMIQSDAYPGQQLKGTVATLSPTMVQRKPLAAGPADKGPGDVREAIVALDPAEAKWPLGLTVKVEFAPCNHPASSPD